MTIFPSNLEGEIALLVFKLRAARMSLRESAIYYNSLRLTPPAYSLESRLESLAVEIAYLRKRLT